MSKPTLQTQYTIWLKRYVTNDRRKVSFMATGQDDAMDYLGTRFPSDEWETIKIERGDARHLQVKEGWGV